MVEIVNLNKIIFLDINDDLDQENKNVNEEPVDLDQVLRDAKKINNDILGNESPEAEKSKPEVPTPKNHLPSVEESQQMDLQEQEDFQIHRPAVEGMNKIGRDRINELGRDGKSAKSNTNEESSSENSSSDKTAVGVRFDFMPY